VSNGATAAVTLADLSRIATHAHAAQRAALTASYLADGGQGVAPEEAAQASTYAKTASVEAGKALSLLMRHGAKAATLPAPAHDIPLHQLDTPDARRLLDLLTEAQAVAERLDLARGRALASDFPLAAGETRGVDLAESIGELAQRLQGEIHGPQSGRE